MFNIIKADLYRITHGIGFYITIAVLLVFLVLQTFSNGQGTIGVDIDSIQNPDRYETVISDSGEEIMVYTPPSVEATGRTIPLLLANGTNNMIYFLLPFIVFIAASDFSHGVVKNLLAGGSSRVKYYVAKLMITAAVCVIIMLLYIAVPILITTIWRGFGGNFDGAFIRGLLKVYLPQLYLLFAFNCIGLFLAFTFKRTAVLNTVFIGFSFVPILIIIILQDINEKFLDLINYDLVFNFQSFAYPDGAVPPNLTRALILGGAYIISCTVGGILMFRKSEIK